MKTLINQSVHVHELPRSRPLLFRELGENRPELLFIEKRPYSQNRLGVFRGLAATLRVDGHLMYRIGFRNRNVNDAPQHRTSTELPERISI